MPPGLACGGLAATLWELRLLEKCPDWTCEQLCTLAGWTEARWVFGENPALPLENGLSRQRQRGETGTPQNVSPEHESFWGRPPGWTKGSDRKRWEAAEQTVLAYLWVLVT